MTGQENIDELLGKYFSGETSPEEAIFLEDWKSKSKQNRLHFTQCERIFYFRTYPLDMEKDWQKVKSQIAVPDKIKSINPFINYLRIAASIALLIGLGTMWRYWWNNTHPDAVSYVANTQTKQVLLSDGSKVTISANSSVTAEEGFGKKARTLHLKGSAYFSVVHNEKIPFVVDAGGVFIKDIGTRFFIRTSPDTDTVHVHVDEGIVLLFDDKNTNIEIKARENALYVKSTKRIVLSEPPSVAPARFIFSNNTLAEVVEKLNEAYNAHIEIANPALNNCTLTTQFNNEKLETILSVISETLGLTYEKKGNRYIIKGVQCHP